MNGKCCDANMKPLVGCFFECEHFFEISARPYPGNKTTLSYIKTYVLSNVNTTFTDGIQLNRRQKNPWIFIYEKPYVSFVSINIVFFFNFHNSIIVNSSTHHNLELKLKC